MELQSHFPLLTLLSAAFLFHLAAANHHAAANTEFIRTRCGTTLYPNLCFTCLSDYADAIRQNHALLARVAITLSLSKARNLARYLESISVPTTNASGTSAFAALKDCVSVFGDAVEQIGESHDQMKRLGSDGVPLRLELSNVQTWMSAGLTNEDTCIVGFSSVPACAVKTDVCNRVVEMKEFTSNALALVNGYVSHVTN